MKSPTWYSSHVQSPNPNTIADAMLYLQTGAWHGFPLRGSTSTGLRQILTVNYWTKPRDPYRSFRGRTEVSEADCNPIGRTIVIVSTNQTPQSSHGLSHHQSKNTHRLAVAPTTYVRQGLPCLTSVGRDAMCGPLVDWCLRGEQCLRCVVGVEGWGKHPCRGKGKKGWGECSWKGNQEGGIWKINK